MKDETASKIDALMRGFTERQEARAKQTTDAQEAERCATAEFNEVRSRVIKPVLEAIAARLKAGGYEARVLAYEEEVGTELKPRRASAIEMTIQVPTGASAGLVADVAAVTFVRASNGISVSLRKGEATSNTGRGFISMSKVDADAVEKQVLDFLNKTFGS